MAKTTSKATRTTSKRIQSKDLLDWVNVQWFQHIFVTTYMVFIGQTANPWDVPVKHSVLVMQRIWDATSHHEYEITTSSSVYKKACDQFLSRVMTLWHISDSSMPCGLMVQCYWIRWHCSNPGILRFSRRVGEIRWSVTNPIFTFSY